LSFLAVHLSTWQDLAVRYAESSGHFHWEAQAASLPLSAASRNASRDPQSNIEIGSQQAAANYRPAACAPRKIISGREADDFFAARISAPPLTKWHWIN